MGAVEPIETRDYVAAFLFGHVAQASMIEEISDIEISENKGQPALILRSNEGIHTFRMIHVEKNRFETYILSRTQAS